MPAPGRHHPRQPAARRPFALQTLFLALLALLLALPAAAEDLGWFSAMRLHGEADDALEGGNYQAAAELYQQLVDGLDRGQTRRARALYSGALAHLNIGERQVADSMLGELLEVFPNYKKSLDAEALRLLIEVEAPEPAVEVAAESVDEEPTAEPEADAESGEVRVRRLETKVARLERDLRAARAELQKKEEAIEQLKELMVGEGG